MARNTTTQVPGLDCCCKSTVVDVFPTAQPARLLRSGMIWITIPPFLSRLHPFPTVNRFLTILNSCARPNPPNLIISSLFTVCHSVQHSAALPQQPHRVQCLASHLGTYPPRLLSLFPLASSCFSSHCSLCCKEDDDHGVLLVIKIQSRTFKACRSCSVVN